MASVHVFRVIIAGWSSNSIYAILGTIRAVAQTISYELPLSCIVLGICFQLKRYSFIAFSSRATFPFCFILSDFPVFFVWICLIIAELHRAPFDLPEAERELVSGYNTDFGATGFILLYVSEYANIVFAGQVSMLFWAHSLWWGVLIAAGILSSSYILFLRAVFPRAYYNGLMESCWKIFLPFVFFWFILVFLLK